MSSRSDIPKLEAQLIIVRKTESLKKEWRSCSEIMIDEGVFLGGNNERVNSISLSG